MELESFSYIPPLLSNRKHTFKNANIPSYVFWGSTVISIPSLWHTPDIITVCSKNINTKIHENHSNSDTSIKYYMYISTVLQFMKIMIPAKKIQHFHLQTSISDQRWDLWTIHTYFQSSLNQLLMLNVLTLWRTIQFLLK